MLPARNEADRIGASIAAIVTASRLVPGHAVALTVVDHESSDGTADEARRAFARHRAGNVATQLVNAVGGGVGSARHVGVVAATGSWRQADRAWVLSTDADSRVRPDWIVRHLGHAEAGAIAVAGVVDLLPDADSNAFRDRWRAEYGATIDADGGHPHAHAANLGIRLDAYRRVGGFADAPGADDTDLWRRLGAAGLVPVADAGIVVDTSGRRVGRVRTGFAYALATLFPVDRGAHAPEHAPSDTLVPVVGD